MFFVRVMLLVMLLVFLFSARFGRTFWLKSWIDGRIVVWCPKEAGKSSLGPCEQTLGWNFPVVPPKGSRI